MGFREILWTDKSRSVLLTPRLPPGSFLIKHAHFNSVNRTDSEIFLHVIIPPHLRLWTDTGRNLAKVVLIVFQVQLFFQATVKQGGKSYSERVSPGCWQASPTPYARVSIQKTWLFHISDELCRHRLMAGGLLPVFVRENICLWFKCHVWIFYEGKMLVHCQD